MLIAFPIFYLMASTNYMLKVRNDDFEVTEVPLLPRFRGEGPFTYIWLKKSGYTTFDAQEFLKIFFELEYEDVSAEGLKDEDGITSQIISMRKALVQSDLDAFNGSHSGEKSYISLERILGYGREPVQPKMLHGNCFDLIVRDLEKDAAESVVEYCRDNKFISFINYYDSQRFGMPGGPFNTHLIGKAIIEEDWEEAYTQLVRSNNKIGTIPPSAEPKGIFAGLNPKKVDFFVSAYESYHWNHALSEDLQKSNNGAHHKFENVAELFVPGGNVFVAKNIFSNEGYKIGPGMKPIRRENSRCAIITTAIYVLEVGDDDLNKGCCKLRLAFFLPAGCYATMCVRQLIQKATA